jgi:[ribosomal protein S5]-alanine N-acetyltransferase
VPLPSAYSGGDVGLPRAPPRTGYGDRVKSRLRTKRLDLSVFTLDDAEALHAIFADPRTHTIGSGPFSDLAQTQRWIANRIALFETAELAWYAVRVSGGEEIIGNCGMLVGRRTIEDPEIGYEITASARRNGYAMEAAQAVVNECAASGLNRIWATIRPSNLPSLRIVQALGFTLPRPKTM